MQIKSWQIALVGVIIHFFMAPLLLSSFFENDFDNTTFNFFDTILKSYLIVLIYDPLFFLISGLGVISVFFLFYNKFNLFNKIFKIISIVFAIVLFFGLFIIINIDTILINSIAYGGLIMVFLIIASFYFQKESKIQS